MNSMKHALVFILLFGCTLLFASSVREIVMTDGSIITGEIISLNDGECVIQSPTLGKLVLKSDNIETIRKKGSKSVTAAESINEISTPQNTASENHGNKMKTTAGINSLKSSLMSNPDALNAVMSLQSDPDMQAILTDPAIMEMIKNGNYDSLMNNPKIINLMNNPKINSIRTKITE